MRDHSRMPGSAAIYRKIERLLKARGMAERDASMKATGKPDMVRDIKRGRMPGADKMAALAGVLGVPVEHLVDPGDVPMHHAPDAIQDAPPNYVAIEAAPVPAGAGDGGDGEQLANHRALLWFREQLIRGELNARPEDIKYLRVRGQSMEPILRHGDEVLIDIRDRDFHAEGIFALWDGDGLVIKWVQPVRGADPPRVRMSSENPRMEPYDRLRDEVNIIGRVVWFARRMA